MRWCASAFGNTFVRIQRAMRALAEGAEMSSRQTVPDADPLELLKIITLERVTELTTLSVDSLKRHHAGKVSASARAVSACAWATPRHRRVNATALPAATS